MASVVLSLFMDTSASAFATDDRARKKNYGRVRIIIIYCFGQTVIKWKIELKLISWANLIHFLIQLKYLLFIQCHVTANVRWFPASQ